MLFLCFLALVPSVLVSLDQRSGNERQARMQSIRTKTRATRLLFLTRLSSGGEDNKIVFSMVSFDAEFFVYG